MNRFNDGSAGQRHQQGAIRAIIDVAEVDDGDAQDRLIKKVLGAGNVDGAVIVDKVRCSVDVDQPVCGGKVHAGLPFLSADPALFATEAMLADVTAEVQLLPSRSKGGVLVL